ncbi:MAG: glycosyltransferase family 4 protein [Acidimicrobiia bacterium]|nr:glycosyltransferase family 4 protein [Acidimicrobiia bacterium]
MTEPLRVGILCPYSLAWPGGVQTHVLAVARALEGRGVRADVLAPTDGVRIDTDVRVRSLGRAVPVPANGSTARIALGPQAIANALRFARSYDLVHLHEPLVPGAALAVALRRPVPLVGTFHAASEGGYWGYALGRPLMRPAWNHLDTRLAVSKAARERVTRYFDGAIDLFPNGVDVRRHAEASPYGRSAAEHVVLFVGRDEPRKGLRHLIDAFAEVREAAPGVELWIAGPDTDSIRGTGIRSFGRVDDTTLASLFRGADVFCAPSTFGESFGIVLLEAMAAGTPVVATDIPGYAAVARPDRDEAVLVPPGDTAALAGALVSVLSDFARRERMRQAGRARAAEFDWEKLSGDLASRYRDLVS